MPLHASDFALASRLLDEAMDLPPADAQVWLAALPLECAHLRDTLREMLAVPSSLAQGQFLESGPRLEGDSPLADGTMATASDRVGPYRLIREIGCGGMGLEWLAERADEQGLKRQVALKLPRLAWGSGLSERKERERDIGALLEHLHLARPYDAGVDELGGPYLAMEYIDGVPLDLWCKQKSASVADRLRIFLQVTAALA